LFFATDIKNLIAKVYSFTVRSEITDMARKSQIT